MTVCSVSVSLVLSLIHIYVFSITGRGTVATGRIETGIVKVGEEVQIIGLGAAGKKSVVTGVEMFRKLLDQGEAGDNVGLLLSLIHIYGAKPDTATFTDLYVTYNRGVVC